MDNWPGPEVPGLEPIYESTVNICSWKAQQTATWRQKVTETNDLKEKKKLQIDAKWKQQDVKEMLNYWRDIQQHIYIIKTQSVKEVFVASY